MQLRLNAGKWTLTPVSSFSYFPAHDIVHATFGHYFPDDMLNIVVFTNYDGTSPVSLAANIARMAYGGAPEAPRPRQQRSGRT